MASRCTTEFVEPPMAALALMAFSKAWRVRIFDSTQIFVHHLDDAAAGKLRKTIAARIDGRNRRVAG